MRPDSQLTPNTNPIEGNAKASPPVGNTTAPAQWGTYQPPQSNINRFVGVGDMLDDETARRAALSSGSGSSAISPSSLVLPGKKGMLKYLGISLGVVAAIAVITTLVAFRQNGANKAALSTQNDQKIANSAILDSSFDSSTLKINRDTVVSGGKGLSVFGTVAIQNEADSVNAFSIQNSQGGNLLVADTKDNRIAINGKPVGTAALQVNGDISTNGALITPTAKFDADGLHIGNSLVCTARGCISSSSPSPTPTNPTIDVASLAYINKNETFAGDITIKNSAVAGFQVQTSAGNSLLSIDTSNGRVGINITPVAGGANLQVGGNVNITGLYQVAGNSGSSLACAPGEIVQQQTVQGGIITGGSCTVIAGATTPTLQQAYDASGSGTIGLSSAIGPINIQDNSTPLGSNLFSVKSSGGTVYFAASASGASVTGNVNITGQYQVSGSQISSANLSNDSSLAKLGSNQSFTGNNTFSSASNSFTGSGSGLTGLNASNVSSGTLSDSRLSNNVALLNANNQFSGNNTFVLNSSGLSVQDASSPLGTNLFQVTNNSGSTKYFTVSATQLQFNGQDVCTASGNCAGAGGGVTTTGGTTNKLAKFTSAQGVVDSIITDDGSTVTIGGTLAVNTLSPTAALTIGVTGQGLTLQGNGTTSLKATSGGITNSLVFAAPSASNKTITIPNASGTVAISSSGPLSLDGAGNLTCPTCLTTDGTGGGSGVSSVNGMVGNVGIAGTPNQISVSNSLGTVTLSTPQDIATTSTPTFANLNVGSGGELRINNNSINTAGTLSNVAYLSQNQTFTGTNAIKSTNSTAFQVQNAGAADTLLTVDTSARSISGGNIVKVGNSTGTDTDTTILVLDSATADPTSDLSALSGGLFYNSNTGKISVIENGVVKVICNQTDASCGGNSTTLQQAYNASLSAPQITLNSSPGAGGLVIADNASPLGTDLFDITNNGGSTKFFSVSATGAKIGTNDVCTTAGNCAGAGSGVTTAGGTPGKLAKFSGTQAVADSIITDNGTNISVAGDINTTGQYQVGGVQISSANLSNDGNLAKTNGNNTFSGNNTFTGTVLAKTTSTTAFQLQNATGGSTLIYGDTSNMRLGVGQATANYTLDVAGDVNTSTGFRVGGTSGAGVTCSSGNVLSNIVVTGGIVTGGTCAVNGGGISPTLQNVYDNSGTPATITTSSSSKGVLIKAGASADSTALFQLQNSGGSNLFNADTTNMRLAVDATYSAMGTPTGLSVGAATAGGSLTGSTTYFYKVTAIDLAGGETAGGTEASGSTGASNKTLPVTWTAVSGAGGYRVYRSTTTGTEVYLTTVLTNSYTDSGTISIGSGSPPSTTSAYVSTNSSNKSLQLSVGGLGKPTGQLYVSGTLPFEVTAGGVATNGSPNSIYIQGKYAYIVTNTLKLQVFDVSNPATPVDVSAGGVTTGGSPNFVYVQGRYAYITEIGVNKLQIFDVSNPAAPVDITNGGVATAAYPESVHVQGRYAFVYAASVGKLQIFDVSNPAAPVDITNGGVATLSGAASSQRQIYVQGRYAYILDNGLGDKLQIFDVSNPAAPVDVTGGGITTADNPDSIFVQGRYAYMVADSGKKFQTFDVSNPAAPVDITGGGIATGGSSTPWGLSVQGRYAYMIDIGTNKLRTYDLGGAYVQQLEAGGAEFGTLAVDSNSSFAGDVGIAGGLQVGQSAQISGSLSTGGSLYVKGSLALAGGITGGTTLNSLATPGAPTVTPQGTTGATTYSYTITAVGPSGGETLASSVGSTATGNAVLSAFPDNLITWSAVTGATSYKVYRTVSGGTPSSTGLIGTAVNTQFTDTGLAGSGSSPTVNTTGNVTLNSSQTLVKSATDNTTAFQVQNSSGATVLGVDTSNKAISINGGATYQTVVYNPATGFSSAVKYPIVSGGYYMTSVDFNGDTKPDLVSMNSGTTLSVLMNNGDGTFAAKVDYTVSGAQRVTSADFNGDGKPDLALTSTNNGVYIMLNSGTGTFGAPVFYSASNNPVGIAAADFNGDGKLDLAAGNFNNNAVVIFLGNGNGTFGAATNITALKAFGIAIADFNGDGIKDIAASNTTTANFSILLGNGNGTFAPHVEYGSGINGSNSVTAADFNGDGKPDLAFPSSTAGTVVVYLNNGDGTFGAGSNYSVTYNAALTAADFNGDGKPDLVTSANANTMSVLLNNGNGTFAAKTDYAVSSCSTSPGGDSIAAADFNGDGKPDVAMTDCNDAINYKLDILINGASTVTTTHSGAVSINVPNAATTGLIVQAAAGQTDDLLHIQNSSGTLLAGVTSAGVLEANYLDTTSFISPLNIGTSSATNVNIGFSGSNLTVASNLKANGISTFRGATNSTSAFQIQNSSGLNLLSADTTNMNINVTGGNLLLNGLTPTNLIAIAGSNQGGSFSGVAGTTYFYKVTAIVNGSETTASSEASFASGSFVGLSAPTAPTLALTAGSNLGTGVYTYQVTYVTANGETTGGTAAAITTTSGNQAVNLTAIPTGPTGTTARKIYRTTVGGAIEKLLTTIADNTTTVYSDTTVDGSLGANVPGSNTAKTNTNNITVSWAAVPGATSYRIYRGTATNAETAYQTSAVSTLTDTGAAGTVAAMPTLSPFGRLGIGTAAPTASLDVRGTALFKNGVNSTTAFQVQNSSGNSVLNVDTTNAKFGTTLVAPTISSISANNFSCPITVTSCPSTLTASATYYYKLTALDQVGNESLPSAEVSATTASPNNMLVQVNWSSIPGASSYRLYRGTASGAENQYAAISTIDGFSNPIYTDYGQAMTGGTPPVSTNAYASLINSNGRSFINGGGLTIDSGNTIPVGQLYVNNTLPFTNVGSLSYTQGCCSGGQQIRVSGHYAYVINASSAELGIFDITNPANLKLVSNTTITSPNFIEIDGSYVYITTGSGKLVTYDVSNPSTPVLKSQFNLSGITLMKPVVQGRYLYVTENTSNGRLFIIDISNPAQPNIVSSYRFGGNVYGVALSARYAYITTSSGINVLDISNPYNPVQVGALAGSNSLLKGLNGRYLYLEDGGNIHVLRIIDVGDPANPSLVGTLTGFANQSQSFVIAGRTAYWGGTILDLSNPGSPTIIGVQTQLGAYYDIQGRYLFVADASGNFVKSYDMGGAYLQELDAGTVTVSALNVSGNTTLQQSLNIQGGLQVSRNIQATGSLSVVGASNLQGNVNISGGANRLSVPNVPTVTPQGTTGAQRWDYAVTAVSANGGETTASISGTTSSGNATMNAINFNRITWSAVSGATNYKIYRTYVTGATSPTTTGYVGSASSTTFDDTGVSADGSTLPATDTSGQLTVQGSSLFKNYTDSTTAFQVQDSSGQNLINVDTTNSSITLAGLNSGALSSWTTSANSLPVALNNHTSVAANGYVYAIGGFNGTSSQATVYYAKLNSDGTTGTWSTNANSLPQALTWATAVTSGGYIYVLGGLNGGEQSTVYYAKINSDGSTGTWQTNTNALTQPLQHATSVVANGYVYVMGGTDGTAQSTVYYAKINADGSLAAWTTSSNPLPAATSAPSSVVANGYVYVMGGTSSSVYYAKLNTDGSTGSWTTSGNSLPGSLGGASALVSNGYVYYLGGTGSSDVYYAKLNTNGSINAWTTNANAIPQVSWYATSAVVNGYVYLIGGHDGSSGRSTVYYSSTSRIQIGANLDLVGLQGGNLSEDGSLGGGSSGGSITAGNITAVGGLQVQGAANFTQGASVMGNFNISSASGTVLLSADSTSMTITLGAPSATPVLLVLGNKNTSGDPTCTTGAIYYNSNSNQMRACVNGAWNNLAGVNVATALPTTNLYDGRQYRLRQGSSPYDFVLLTYDATYGKWVSEESTVYSTASSGNSSANGGATAVMGNAQTAFIGSFSSAFKAYTDAGLVPQFRINGAVSNTYGSSGFNLAVDLYHISNNTGDKTAVNTISAGWPGTVAGTIYGIDTGWTGITLPGSPKDLLYGEVKMVGNTLGTGDTGTYRGGVQIRWVSP